MPERWDDVRVTVIRPAAVDQRGPCANSIPQDDNKATNLPAGMCSARTPLDHSPSRTDLIGP